MTTPPAEMKHACYICGRPATVADGIVGADLCDSEPCLDAAWDRAFGLAP